MQQKVTAQIGGKEVSIETGKIARLAEGAVTVTCGDTTVLACAVSATMVKQGQDYFPLTVDYREKAAAAGKFPGGYFKREGRPTEKDNLISRIRAWTRTRDDYDPERAGSNGGQTEKRRRVA